MGGISRLQATPPTARRVPTASVGSFGSQESLVDHQGTAILSELKYTLRPVAAALGHAWVASRAGVSRRAVSAWLDGSRVGSIEFAERVAKACGYSVIISAVQTSDYGTRLRLMRATPSSRSAISPPAIRGPFTAFRKPTSNMDTRHTY